MSKNLILLLLLWLLAPGFGQPPQNKPQAKPLVINRVTVIDATGAEAKSDLTVVITSDRITTIGKAAEVKIPKDSQVVEATGKFLIPGLWDMHAHIASQDFLALFIANGVTGVRDMGGVWEALSVWRKLINEDMDRARESFQGLLDRVGAIQRAGVEILAGTDTPNPYCFPGFSLHDELALLVKSGLTPMETLQVATRNAAKFLGLLDSLGTIERGKIADLVLLDANPFAEITNTQKINAVVTGGKLIDRAALQAMLAQAEAAAKRQ